MFTEPLLCTWQAIGSWDTSMNETEDAGLGGIYILTGGTG